MTRIDEFTIDGKNFVSIDFSDIQISSDFVNLVKIVKLRIAEHPENSVYTITNLYEIKFVSEIKRATVDLLKENKPYVRYGAVFGIDGVQKMMLAEMFKLSGRTNMIFAFSREKAIEKLLKLDQGNAG